MSLKYSNGNCLAWVSSHFLSCSFYPLILPFLLSTSHYSGGDHSKLPAIVDRHPRHTKKSDVESELK